MKELEERGIGRPSTYASVIDTLLRRDYVWKKGTALVPSWTAFAKQQLLERHFPHLIDYEFTATMEEALDAIARGEGEAEKWLHTFWYGNGQAGLKELVDDEHLATIDPAVVNAITIGADANGEAYIVRVWNNGASVQLGDDRAPVPADLAPDELTTEKAAEIIEKGSGGPRVLGDDPETGMPVLVLTGRFGPFVQLGEMLDGAKEKPKRASLLSGQEPDTVNLDDALALLSLPRVVGVLEDGTEVTALNGRYGPYLKKGTDSRSLESDTQLFTVTMAEAEALFAQPKRRGGRTKPPIAELGPHPESGANVRVLDGRFGPYVTDGTINATVPRGVEPAEIDLAAAIELLREREARGPAEKRPAKRAAKQAHDQEAAEDHEAGRQEAQPEGQSRRGGETQCHQARPERRGRRRGRPSSLNAVVSAEQPAPFIPSRPDEVPAAPWRVFGTRSYFRLWLAQVVSSTGDWIGLIAILAIAARISDNSGAAVSLVMLVRVIPGFFLGTVGGVIIDRFDRRMVMVSCDIGRATLLALLPFVDGLVGLVIISFGLEVLTLLWGPAQAASVPHLVDEKQLTNANTLSLIASYATFPLASIAFSLLAALAVWLGSLDALSSLSVDQETLALLVDAFDVPRFRRCSSSACRFRTTRPARPNGCTGHRPFATCAKA